MDEFEEIKKRKLQKMMNKLENKKKSKDKIVCIATMGQNGLYDYVSEHFGRSPTFTIVNLSTNEVKVIPNTSEHMGGFGYPPEIMAKEGVEVVLCSSLGPRAIGMFEQYGIEVYVGATGMVKDAIQAWQTGRLHVATNENACRLHRHRQC
jgi:predicted Fe-Mo cluster-binding NifX family protein